MPRDAAIFCQIEKERRCATPTDQAMGIRLAAAALALNTGQPGSNIGIDESPDARARCGGLPEAVIFYGPFPKGHTSCVNCGEVVGSAKYPDANAACVAQCLDFFGTVNADGSVTPSNPPTAANQAYCQSHARVATNAPVNGCFAGACTAGGAEMPEFLDPRRIPEEVVWTDLIGTSANGSSLTKTGVSSPQPNAGGASTQRFTTGDGYVEFSSSAANLGFSLGVSSDPAGCAPPCSDTDPSAAGLGFGLVLLGDGRVYVGESGTIVNGPGPNGSFRTYTAGERFRVTIRDNADGTARVIYSRIIGTCTPGSPCADDVIHTSPIAAPRYPFRVDAIFLDQGATATDVRIVRIQ